MDPLDTMLYRLMLDKAEEMDEYVAEQSLHSKKSFDEDDDLACDDDNFDRDDFDEYDDDFDEFDDDDDDDFDEFDDDDDDECEATHYPWDD